LILIGRNRVTVSEPSDCHYYTYILKLHRLIIPKICEPVYKNKMTQEHAYFISFELKWRIYIQVPRHIPDNSNMKHVIKDRLQNQSIISPVIP
jgi:hypothetical protein